ncbi:MAG: hypothetical protein RugAbin2_00675 [Rugosibacter sp.]|nr:hypothetical protein [Rugosibacter sp.]
MMFLLLKGKNYDQDLVLSGMCVLTCDPLKIKIKIKERDTQEESVCAFSVYEWMRY